MAGNGHAHGALGHEIGSWCRRIPVLVFSRRVGMAPKTFGDRMSPLLRFKHSLTYITLVMVRRAATITETTVAITMTSIVLQPNNWPSTL